MSESEQGAQGAQPGPVELRIRPIDATAPGSYRQTQRILAALAQISALDRIDDIKTSEDLAQVAEGLQAFSSLEDIVRAQAMPTNGLTIDEALDQISSAQFYEILSGLLASPLK